MMRFAILALLLTGCAADWRDRSALSAVDAADLGTLNMICQIDQAAVSSAIAHDPSTYWGMPLGKLPVERIQDTAATCIATTHRMMCHARIGECP